MTRILTEVLLHKTEPRLWVLELMLEKDGTFAIRKHVGTYTKLRTSTEKIYGPQKYPDYPAFDYFDSKVEKKLKRDKNYRYPEDGEIVDSLELLRIFSDALQPQVNQYKQELTEPEFRKLRI